MADQLAEIHAKAEAYRSKYNDDELYDYLLTLANKVEQLEMLKHHFGYFIMHAQAVSPYDARPKHFREALDRAKKILEELG